MRPGGSKGTFLLTASLLLIVTATFYLVAQYRKNGLNRYPGPWLAKFTKLWLRLNVKTNQHQHHLLELHRRYGPTIRIGPNNLSIASPECVALIYGVKNEFLKVTLGSKVPPGVLLTLQRVTCMILLLRGSTGSLWPRGCLFESQRLMPALRSPLQAHTPYLG